MLEEITEVCREMEEFLLSKNQSYGNSVADPVRIFHKGSPMDAINARIDDKLSRLARGCTSQEDTELDLIGYLILKRAMEKRAKKLGHPLYT